MKLGRVKFLAVLGFSFIPALDARRHHASQLHDLTPGPHYSGRETDLIYLHRKLITQESITGNELGVGKWLAKLLRAQNLTVELQKVSSNRYNILAYPKGTPDTEVLLTSHIDTVPPFLDYEYRRHDGSDDASDDSSVDVHSKLELKKRSWRRSKAKDTIWGRGSVDAKACVAAQTIAMLELLSSARASNLAPPSVSLLFVVGEEKGGDGMRYFSSHAPTNYSAVVFGEPTEGKLASGHKGNMGLHLSVKGKAAHSGYPWLGVSANDIMVEALTRLKALEPSLPRSEKYGMTTLNIGRVDGGVAMNVVAEEAKAEIMLRLAADEAEKIRSMIHETLQSTEEHAKEKGGSLEIEYFSEGYGPTDIDTDIPGFESMAVNYGTDIPNLEGTHKRYMYGPGSILVAHSDHEHLTVAELERAVYDYKRILDVLLHR